MSLSPGTLYRRAVRRVDRRSESFRVNRPVGYVMAEHANHCNDCARRWRLLCEAVVLANYLAIKGGIAPFRVRP